MASTNNEEKNKEKGVEETKSEFKNEKENIIELKDVNNNNSSSLNKPIS